MSYQTKTVLTAFTALTFVGSANAATISVLNYSSGDFAWPTDDALVDNEETFAGAFAGSSLDVDNDRDLGQTFTMTSEGTIDKIAISFDQFNSGGSATLTLNFFKATSASDITAVGGIIDTITFNATDLTNAGLTGTGGVLVVDVADTAVLNGEVYAWQFDVAASSSHIIKLRRDSESARSQGGATATGYDGGQAFFENVSLTGTNAPDDWYFGVYGDVVPEPGSLALLAAGGLCVLRRRRIS